MSLFLHLLLHVSLGVLAGIIVWRMWRQFWISFFAGLTGSVLVDLDHFIDYWLAFGPHFSLNSFIHGYQFLQSDRIYVLFHGWEYVILLGGLVWLIHPGKRLRSAIFGFAVGLFFHLLVDVNVNNGLTVKSYSVLYRAAEQFEMQSLVTPEHYEKHQRAKETTPIPRL